MEKILNNLRESFSDKTREKHWWAFFIAFGAASLMLLPFVIYDQGYFLFFGDLLCIK